MLSVYPFLHAPIFSNKDLRIKPIFYFFRLRTSLAPNILGFIRARGYCCLELSPHGGSLVSSKDLTGHFVVLPVKVPGALKFPVNLLVTSLINIWDSSLCSALCFLIRGT